MTTPSVQVFVDLGGGDLIPHTFILVTHPDGSTTEYGLVPLHNGEPSDLGRIDITGTGDTGPHESTFAGEIQSMTQTQYDQLMNYINMSIINPPDYILPGTWWPDNNGTNCTGWVINAFSYADLTTQFGFTTQGTWNPYGQGLMYGIGQIFSGIGQSVNDFFNSAINWVPPRVDPLVFDFDGDGIETVGTDASILFDHNGDGIKTGTGWVRSDDGFLVLDRNGNGSIDNGSELFGVDTVLSNGQLATDGFSALKDVDSNQDNLFDVNDAQFSSVRIWRDLNQNGISDTGELMSFADAGIASINLNATSTSVTLTGNNLESATSTYTRTDGTTSKVANLNFVENNFDRVFVTPLTLTAEVMVLPEMRGSGSVRDLREAVSLDVSGQTGILLSQYAGATTRAEQLALLDLLINAWGDTSLMSTSIDTSRLLTRYDYDFGNTGINYDSFPEITVIEALKSGNPVLYGKYEALERFNGSNILERLGIKGVGNQRGQLRICF